MTTRKITLTLPEELITAAEAAVRAGRARSVSAYVAAAAGAGEARLSLAEVMDRWRGTAEPTADQTTAAEQWAAGLAERADTRLAERTAHATGHAA